MPHLRRDGVDVHYEVHGAGRPVVLLHGGTVDFKTNYGVFGWVKTLTARGLQVIGLDLRGHGKSGKPHEVSAYGTGPLADDVLAVLDAVGAGACGVVGYSLGTVVALYLLQHHGARFTRAALVATGDGLVGVPPFTFERVFPALGQVLARTEYPKDLPKHLAAYWSFIETTKGDRAALNALSRAAYPALSAAEAKGITTPTLVVSGAVDPVLGQGSQLAAALGAGTYLEVPGADHFTLATDAGVQRAVADWLG